MRSDEVLSQRIDHERELREAEKVAFDHERELRRVHDDQERELRLQAEAAVEKARQLQFDTLELRLEGMNEFRAQLAKQASTFMPIAAFEREHTGLRERYEREHQALIERHVRDIADLSDKIVAQEKVTIRQDVTQEVLRNISDSASTNRRWMIGILVTSGLSLLALTLHLAGLY